MKVGVYNHKCVVDFSDVEKYLNGLIKKYKASYERNKRKPYPKKIYERKLSQLNEALNEFQETLPSYETFFKDLMKLFRTFSSLEKFPEEVGRLFWREYEVRIAPDKTIKRRRIMRRVPSIFGSRILPEVSDILSINRTHVGKGKWLFDVVTIKKDGLKVFQKHLHCIPPFKKELKSLKEKRQYSTRHTFRPYPLATKLWLRHEASVHVPPDLKSFLEGAIDYFFSGEWRTSIVLSAITVESILADLYEEKYKKPAPDTPLGELYRLVKEKIDFPSEIAGAIDMANKSRISAVHRSRFPVSDREATNALYGATNFTLWYASEF